MKSLHLGDKKLLKVGLDQPSRTSIGLNIGGGPSSGDPDGQLCPFWLSAVWMIAALCRRSRSPQQKLIRAAGPLRLLLISYPDQSRLNADVM
jgi:hypothetical protein